MPKNQNHAQEEFNEARRLNNEAASLYAQGRLREAEHLYRTALNLSTNDPIIVAGIASNLGALYKRLNRYGEAEQLFLSRLLFFDEAHQAGEAGGHFIECP